MKILHTSDIHLDSPMTTRLTPREATERKREILATFRRMIDIAVSGGYTAFIIAGDLFDNERVGIRTLDAAVGAIEAAKNVTFFYLPGNHEKQRLTASGLKLPDNLKIFGEDWTYFELDGITFAGRSKLSSDMFDTVKLKDDGLNVVVLHGELAARSDALSKIGKLDAERLPIDYLALGHYHTYAKTDFGRRGIAVYSGTPEGRGFDESGVKGYVTVNISGYGIDSTFTRAASRLIEIVNVDISGAIREIDIESRVESALAEIDKRSLVRVLLCGEHTPETKRNTDALKRRFSGNFYYLEVNDESKLKISAEDYKNDRSLKGEFIRLVMSKSELSDIDKADIIECGIRALAGETE